ncbi:hypothetical protein TWF481_008861 [Arthrobotrys musiformis]|uniref:F-box domain-containing protein n=1 Tax=Arthrobotrys musiformis TaxID=47236 RepID=A0AAV9W9X1_9PEZI
MAETDTTNTRPLLPLEIQLIILEHAPWESHPALSLVCHAWRTFLLTSSSILRNRYKSYKLPLNRAKGPKTRFEEPLYHKVLSYLTHYVRMDDGDYHACYFKPPSFQCGTGSATKYRLNPTFFANDLLSAESPTLVGEGKGKGKSLSRLAFNNTYAHEKTAPFKRPSYGWKSQAAKIPTVGEFLEKNGRAVNNRLADYYTNYSHADILNVVMKYTQNEDGLCFLEFALLPLARSSGNANSARESEVVSSRQELGLDDERGKTWGLVRRWEVMRKLKGMVKRRTMSGGFEVAASGLGAYYEGKELQTVWGRSGIQNILS